MAQPFNSFSELVEDLLKFRRERDWEQFHTPKNMAISLSLEASELLEVFQWREDGDALQSGDVKRCADELADILYWVLLISNDLGIDLVSAFTEKMQKNREKYPVSKARGSAKKYDQL